MSGNSMAQFLRSGLMQSWQKSNWWKIWQRWIVFCIYVLSKMYNHTDSAVSWAVHCDSLYQHSYCECWVRRSTTIWNKGRSIKCLVLIFFLLHLTINYRSEFMLPAAAAAAAWHVNCILELVQFQQSQEISLNTLLHLQFWNYTYRNLNLLHHMVYNASSISVLHPTTRIIVHQQEIIQQPMFDFGGWKLEIVTTLCSTSKLTKERFVFTFAVNVCARFVRIV